MYNRVNNVIYAFGVDTYHFDNVQILFFAVRNCIAPEPKRLPSKIILILFAARRIFPDRPAPY